jgi:hypothetical protein
LGTQADQGPQGLDQKAEFPFFYYFALIFRNFRMKKVDQTPSHCGKPSNRVTKNLKQAKNFP